MDFCKMNNRAQRLNLPHQVHHHTQNQPSSPPFHCCQFKKCWVNRLVCYEVAFGQINKLPGITVLNI